MLYPFTFQPLFKERVWGARNLETLYGKKLPPGKVIGESWEISDRAGDVSIIANGAFAGKDLRWLMEHHQHDLLGDTRTQDGRFPLLVKLLDAQEKLSLQVHPPASKAAELGGEPKTEMWYVSRATPGAELYVGLKHGITRAEFEERIRTGTVTECFHRIPVQAGDAMFLPSGRVHAIGAGLVIFEIQQNSDTTYRVFDWNRVSADGTPRETHVVQSLASIDFNDFEPGLVTSEFTGGDKWRRRQLVRHELFQVDEHHAAAQLTLAVEPRRLQIIAVVTGEIRVGDGQVSETLGPGRFCLIPARTKPTSLVTTKPSVLLWTESGV